MLYLILPRKQEQVKHKIIRRREIIKKKGRYQQNKEQKTIQRINETKSWFFEKISKTDKSLANLTKMRREKTQINKIRNEKVEITRNTKEIQGIIRDNFKNLYLNEFENLEEMDKLLDTYNNSKLNQKDINHLNRSNPNTVKLKQQ
jgi:hypothetical protein